jgi:hypothetical protein
MSFVDVDALTAQHQAYIDKISPNDPLAPQLRAAAQEALDTVLQRNGVGVPSEVFARLEKDHQRALADLNPDDKNSLVYGQPQRAAEAKQRLVDGFNKTLVRWGITPPAPKSEAELAHDRFEAEWASEGLSPHTQALVREQILAHNAMAPELRATHVAALKREFGDAEYDQLVKEARAGWDPKEMFQPGILSSKYALTLLATLGRRELAYSRARRAAGYVS